MRSSKLPDREAYFELKCRARSGLISAVRRFLGIWLDPVLGDPDAVARAALAVHELLENALQYASDGAATLRVEVLREGGALVVLIQTWNLASADHVSALERMLHEIARLPYEQHLARSVRQDRHSSSSGLGLARVRAEGEAALSHEVIGNQVSISARIRAASTV